MNFLYNPFSSLNSSNANVINVNDIQIMLAREVSFREYNNSDSLLVGYISRKFSAKLKNTGCYMIMINSTEEEGPCGIFCVCRANSTDVGVINTLCKTKGVNGENIELEWNSQEAISLKLQTSTSKIFFQHKVLEFRVRVFLC